LETGKHFFCFWLWRGWRRCLLVGGRRFRGRRRRRSRGNRRFLLFGRGPFSRFSPLIGQRLDIEEVLPPG